ncbi:MAG: tRNA 4-thiouridine(8) synthase ThiI [Clostridia bacterium]|nr:tRNA 4-thiouridine(8) synthase ThiI [Clostridia bacterium]
MEKVILIRYCEIHLKGKNRGFFEKLLENNIKGELSSFGAKVEKIPGRYVAFGYDEKNEGRIIEKLKCVSCIFSFSPAIKIKTNYEDINQLCLSMSKDKSGTFKIETNRADKTFKMTSMQVSCEIGGNCLENNSKLKVDVKNPDFVINIDIRENGITYVFSEVIYGIGGMPVGSAGKGLLLLSGGIDSPVAGFMMAKRGVKVEAVHFHSFPYTSPEAKDKVLRLAKQLTNYCGHINLHVVSVTKIQQAIHKYCHESYMITILRRFMFKIAEKLCKQNGYDMIITGESLGQVASQTIESMTVVQSVLDTTAVMRPLVAFDKLETIDIAKKIGTYKTSIEPFEDCCTVFLPDAPLIKPRLDKVLEQESKLDVDALIEEAMSNIELIEI